MHRQLASCLSLTAVVAATLLGGCRSDDKHKFYSHYERPATVSVVDALNGDTIWTKPVPAGHVLKVQFDRDGVLGDDQLFMAQMTPANDFSWSISPDRKAGGMGPGTSPTRDGGRVDLPGTPVRMGVEYTPFQRPVNTVTPYVEPAASPAPAPDATETPEPAPAPAPAEEAAPAPAPAEEPPPAPAADVTEDAAAPTTDAPAPATGDDAMFK